jgi:D-sedoheptulose 7-phosphate isomerase
VSAIGTEYYGALSAALAEGPPAELDAVTDLLFSAVLGGNGVYTMGNGASAALAAHMACDLGKGTAADLGAPADQVGAPRLRIVSLPDNVALMTAYGNDVNYEYVFVEPLKNLLRPGDVVLAISGSGSSPNVLRALEYARTCGAHTVGFTGSMPGAAQMKARCDITVCTPLTKMEQIEDAHVSFMHIVAISLRAKLAEHRRINNA